MSTPPTPTEPRGVLSAREIAYAAISEAILAGDYGEGQFLDENMLAGSVGLSRTPIREALHRLHAERFVDLVPRRGAQVRVITATEMQEIYEARFVLESNAIMQICQARRGAPPGAAEQVETMEQAAREQDWSTMARTDQAFHLGVMDHHGNAVMSELYRALRPRQVRLAVRTIVEGPHRLATIEREHRDIVLALDEHEGARAVQILAEHLRIVPELMTAFQH